MALRLTQPPQCSAHDMIGSPTGDKLASCTRRRDEGDLLLLQLGMTYVFPPRFQRVSRSAIYVNTVSSFYHPVGMLIFRPLSIVPSPSQSTWRQILLVIPLAHQFGFSSVAARQVKMPDAASKVQTTPHILGAIIARLDGNRDLLTCQRSSSSMFEQASKRLY
jgi:hypothetical protein